jgi:TorA maturation chaperone TorD/DNA-binding transcriptional regulator YdaS (Cro superfamily)
LRDQGLKEAIQAVGGVTELARRIGIAQPSVSNWDQIPADRVMAVEAATGVTRMRLRPDLYVGGIVSGDVDEIDSQRAQEYALLSTLLSRAPTKLLLSRLAKLRGDASPIGIAHVGLAEAASRIDSALVDREFFDLFVGLGRGELLPYASYYLTGFLNERPLSRLREDLARLEIERIDGNYEPEDHAGTLCEIMAGLAGGRFPAPEGSQRQIFGKHIAPWMGRLFADMERAESADFYRHVGTLGRLFLEIEAEAFTLAD